MTVLGTSEVITVKQCEGEGPKAVVSAPDEMQLVAAVRAAIAQGYQVLVQTDTALDGADPIALFAVLVNLGVVEIETTHVSSARRCAAMVQAIEAGRIEPRP